MGCTHSVDTRPTPHSPPPPRLHSTPQTPTQPTTPLPHTRINLRTEGCRKEVQLLKNFVYEIKKPNSACGKQTKGRQTSPPLQSVDPSSIVILL